MKRQNHLHLTLTTLAAFCLSGCAAMAEVGSSEATGTTAASYEWIPSPCDEAGCDAGLEASGAASGTGTLNSGTDSQADAGNGLVTGLDPVADAGTGTITAPIDPTADAGTGTVTAPIDPTADAGTGTVTAPTDPTADAGTGTVTAPTDPTADAGTGTITDPIDPTADAGTGDAGCVATEFATEICGNGIDDNCDGVLDCDDASCKVAGQCGCASSESSCSDGVDNDCNGVTDCNEASCKVTGQCGCASSESSCGDGVDNDCNGVTDCNEASCKVAGQCGCAAFDICGNGADDDCDGAVDECQVHDCAVEDGNGCQSNAGTGNYNSGHGEGSCAGDWDANGDGDGCGGWRFQGYCTRHNDSADPYNPGHLYSERWENYIHWWVASRCGGPSWQTNEAYPRVNCVAGEQIFTCQTPIVLNFGNAPVQFAAATPVAEDFDLAARQDGSAARADWPTAVTPWLAYDRDGNGTIDSGRELFGSATVRADGRAARHGFEALAELDRNRDGVVDSSDPAFGALQLWSDMNGNRVSEARELKSLTDAGVVALEVLYSNAPRCDERGNCEVERARFWFVDLMGTLREASLVDVHVVTPSTTLASAR